LNVEGVVMRQSTASGSFSAPPTAADGDIAAEPAGTKRTGRARRKQRLTLALIDPAPLTRQSLSRMFAKGLPEYVTISASSGEELLDMQGELPACPSMVVMHIKSAQVADPWVQSTFQFLRHHLPDAPVVLLSNRDCAADVVDALAYGLRGYIPTSVEAEVAFAAIRLIQAGGTFIPAHSFRAAAAKLNTGSDCKEREPTKGLDLTPRELSVVDLLRDGTPNKVIATKLEMQESTVKVHVRSIMRKLGVANRTHAASVANQLLGPRAIPALDASRRISNGGTGLLTTHAEAPSG
jgi:DNA-binding NarL/FixJ family response regulator